MLLCSFQWFGSGIVIKVFNLFGRSGHTHAHTQSRTLTLNIPQSQPGPLSLEPGLKGYAHGIDAGLLSKL